MTSYAVKVDGHIAVSNCDYDYAVEFVDCYREEFDGFCEIVREVA